MFIPIGLVFVSYTLVTWGRILIKDMNITFLAWVNPIPGHQYHWPADGNVPQIPGTQVWPGKAEASASTAPPSGNSGPNLGEVPLW